MAQQQDRDVLRQAISPRLRGSTYREPFCRQKLGHFVLDVGLKIRYHAQY